MRLLDTDILDIFNSCINGNLNNIEIKWKNTFACTVVLASGGYPGNYEKGKIISGLAPLLVEEGVGGGDLKKNHLAFGTPPQKGGENNIVIFHAGTKLDENGNLVTNGGRVLGISSVGNTLEEALEKAYKAIENISFEGMQYRKDIGKKALR
jgi:phosphoribosylamine--glycine ligase